MNAPVDAGAFVVYACHHGAMPKGNLMLAQKPSTITVLQNTGKDLDKIRAEREALEYYEDLRDDVMSLVKNSQMSYADIHGRCGPCPATLENWSAGRIHKPQLGKIQAVLRILGYDLGVVDQRRKPR